MVEKMVSYDEWLRAAEFVSLRDGKVAYVHRGEGQPLIMVHFWGGESWWFSRVIDRLAEHFSVYAIDLPGLGQSDVPLLPYGVEEFADSAVEFMNRMGVDKADWVGVHGGGLIGAHIAATRPTRIRRLVLDGYPQWNSTEGRQLFRDTVKPTWMDEKEWMIPTYKGWAGISDGSYDYFPSLKGTPEHDVCLHRVGDGFTKNAKWAGEILKEAFKYDSFARVPQIQAPTLCVYGEDDWGGGAVGEGEPPLRRLLHLLRGPESATISNAGLVPAYEQPGPWLRIVLDFLTRLG